MGVGGRVTRDKVVGRPVLATISRNRVATRCSYCFTKGSCARALGALGLALSSACTQLADPAERGGLELHPDGDGSLTVRDGGSEAPGDLSAGNDGYDGDRADRDAGRGPDSPRPSLLMDASTPDATATSNDAADDDSTGDVDSSTPGSAAPCPTGLSFGGSCYRPSRVALSWDDARDDCLAGGGHLVTIDSSEEDDFVAALIGVSVWIGASDRALEGTFVWTDGSALTFDNWGVNQPDAFPAQNCIEKRAEPTAPWYDQTCTNLEFYVCERPLE